jgi:endo-1,4-beta-xylanase
LPDWLTSREWQRQELIDVMWWHITNVVSHYKGVCESWDVVNEALTDDGSLRKSVFLDVIG